MEEHVMYQRVDSNCQVCGRLTGGRGRRRCLGCADGYDRALKVRGSRARSHLPAVITRDGRTCWLCGEPVMEGATGEQCASVDHVVPMSRGGTDDLENLRLAHKLCNTLRGTR